VLPTVVDLERYPGEPNWPERDEFVLGWIGSRSTLPYLEAIAPAIDALADELPQLRLKIICDVFLDLERVPVIKKQWSSHEEAADLQSIDVGLAPLPDNVWTRGKCGFKILQYAAAWRPAIAGPVGANAEIVVDNESGLFASTFEEWQDAIRQLAGHPERARRLGENGRARVADAYSLQAIGDRWVETLVALAQ
jgi:glycosyltransferase involved in cell wall biosynthesis